MHFSCNVADMSSGLSIVTRALAVRSPMQVLEGVLLETCEQGLRLTCTDLALGIETTIPAQIEAEGNAVLPGKLFHEIVRKLPGDTMQVQVSEQFTATIRYAQSRTTLSGMNPADYPELAQVQNASMLQMPQNTLRDMIQKTCFSIATDETRPILTGCLMEIDAEEIRLVALDGFRLALRCTHHEQKLEPMQAVIPGKVLAELAKILSDGDAPVSLHIGETHLSADMGQTRVVTRLLEGEFIRYQQILPTDWQTRIRVLREDLDHAIDRASLIAREGKNNLVKFHIEGHTLTLTSNAELGEVFEQMEILTEGKDLEIAFNVRYVSDILRVLEDEYITLRFNTNVSPCVICPPEGEKYTYLVLPVRVFQA